jgi:hypothetical protein
LVHEHIALIDGGTVRCVQQRQVRDATVRQRSVAHLFRRQPFAELRLIGPHFIGHTRNPNAGMATVDLQNHSQRGSCPSLQCEPAHGGRCESARRRMESQIEPDGQTAPCELAVFIRNRSAAETGGGAGQVHMDTRYRQPIGAVHDAAKRRSIRGLCMYGRVCQEGQEESAAQALFEKNHRLQHRRFRALTPAKNFGELSRR